MAHRNDARAPCTGVGEQILQTVVVPVVDDGAVVMARRPVGVKRFDRRVVERDEVFHIVLMDQQVIGCDAGLARVRQLAERRAVNGSGGERAGRHDGGALPPSSSVKGTRFLPAACMIWRPIAVLPVNTGDRTPVC